MHGVEVRPVSANFSKGPKSPKISAGVGRTLRVLKVEQNGINYRFLGTELAPRDRISNDSDGAE